MNDQKLVSNLNNGKTKNITSILIIIGIIAFFAIGYFINRRFTYQAIDLIKKEIFLISELSSSQQYRIGSIVYSITGFWGWLIWGPSVESEGLIAELAKSQDKNDLKIIAAKYQKELNEQRRLERQEKREEQRDKREEQREKREEQREKREQAQFLRSLN
ncbi:hypothetical protein AB837_00615 [bacterium AB1]|nr:hypothetical protein AB837_00615 [bacterium AB1]